MEKTRLFSSLPNNCFPSQVIVDCSSTIFSYRINLHRIKEQHGSELVRKNAASEYLFSDLSCSMIFIIRNIQVYFDHCSTCTNQRNVLLRGLFFNQTAFKEPFYLVLNNRYFFAQICSIPNISHFSNDHHFSSSPDG